MRKDKEKATALRKAGKSYKQIGHELGIPRGTLSGWFKGQTWSQKIHSRLAGKASLSNPQALRQVMDAKRGYWDKLKEKHRTEAAQEFSHHKHNPLFLAGMMLYWGEGEKQPKSTRVRLGNSEPGMIRMFYLFLTRVINVPASQIIAWLLLYPDLVEPVQKNFWSKATGVPPEQFRKSIYIQGRHATKRLSYGVCTLAVSSRALKERMLVWLELSQDYLRSSAGALEN